MNKWKFLLIGIKVTVETVLYDKDDPKLIKTKYDQTNINTLINPVQKLEGTYQSKYIASLSSNIAQVMDSEEKTLKLLPKAKTDSSGKIVSYNGKSITYEQIKKDTAQYYQYSQFKRLYFNCNQNATKYSNQTGRIISMEFTCTNKLE